MYSSATIIQKINRNEVSSARKVHNAHLLTQMHPKRLLKHTLGTCFPFFDFEEKFFSNGIKVLDVFRKNDVR